MNYLLPIFEVSKLLTNRDIVMRRDLLYITKDKIFLNDDNPYMLIHEVGHILSYEGQYLPNLGMKVIHSKKSYDGDFPDKEEYEDAIASYISKLLFENYINTVKGHLSKKEFDYFQYLINFRSKCSYFINRQEKSINNDKAHLYKRKKQN